MQITKIFTFEGSHVVRNCTSGRCSHSVHGHSYKVEVTFEARSLDNAQMILDFGILKGSVKQFIDSFDHCHVICSKDSDEYRNFFKNHNERWIEIPFNPSAEMLALFFTRWIQHIINKTGFKNGESVGLKVASVTVHETATGRATAFYDDVDVLWKPEWDEVTYSEGVTNDWSTPLYNMIMHNQSFNLIKPKQQIVL